MLAHLKNLDVKDKNPDNPILFFHIPKTAGTSFCKVLENLYGDKYRRIEPNGIRDCLDTYPIGSGFRAFAGHFDLANIHYIKWKLPLTHLTMLRDPVERTLSQYYFLRMNEQHHLHPLAMQYTIDEIYDNGLGVHMAMSNLQVRLLCSLAKAEHRTRRAMLYAQENLLNCFTSFGISEEFTEYIEMCNVDFGWDIKDVPWLNSAPRADQESTHTIDLIRRNNASDLEFYEWAKGIYEKRKEDYILVDIIPGVQPEVSAPRALEPEIVPEPESIPEAEILPEETPPKIRWWRRLFRRIKRVFSR